jgi:hypothetical protein
LKQFLIRFGLSFVFATFSFSLALANNAHSHIECAILKECSGGACSEIKPQPLLLRFVRHPEQLTIWVYGSSQIMGGPQQELSHVFGSQIEDGRTMPLLAGQHGTGAGYMWLDLPTPDSSDQRVFIFDKPLREHNAQCVTPMEIAPGKPTEPVQPFVSGFLGECRWAKSLCNPSGDRE